MLISVSWSADFGVNGPKTFVTNLVMDQRSVHCSPLLPTLPSSVFVFFLVEITDKTESEDGESLSLKSATALEFH